MNHEYIIEKIYHFKCGKCHRWFSISDWVDIPKKLTCPHCGSIGEHVEVVD